MENPIEMDDLGVPLFLETPIYLRGSLHLLGPNKARVQPGAPPKTKHIGAKKGRIFWKFWGSKGSKGSEKVFFWYTPEI